MRKFKDVQIPPSIDKINVKFGHSLSEYNKKYRHKRYKLLCFKLDEVKKFDEINNITFYDSKKKKTLYSYKILKNKKWWFCNEDNSFHEIPRPVRLLWFINLNVLLHSLLGVGFVSVIATSVIVPIYSYTQNLKKGKIIVDGEFKNDVDMTYVLTDKELNVKLECNIEGKKVSEIESIKIKDDNGEITLTQNQFIIKETKKGLLIQIKPEVLEKFSGFVTITVTPSIIEDECSLTKIEVQNEKMYFVGDTLNNFDDFRITGYYSNSTTKTINKGFVSNISLPYTFTETDATNGVTFEFTYSDIKAALTIYPKLHVSSVEMSYDQITIYVGDVWVLNAKIYPTEAYNKDVTWSSSNEAVAKVEGEDNNNGIVTGLSQGTTLVTATSVDNGKSATCIVNVVKKNIKHTVNFYVGDTLISTEEVIEGHKVSKPTVEPLKEKCFFRYWTSNGYDEYDFNQPVMSNLDLKAYFVKDNFIYEDNKTYGGKTITGYNSSKDPAYLIVPSYTVEKINGVLTKIITTEIGEGAFSQYSYDDSINYVYIPKTIKRLDDNAFHQNMDLTEIEIEDNSELEEIGYDCFWCVGCWNGLDFDLSKLSKLKKMASLVFYGAGLKGDVVLPESLEQLGSQAFHYCSMITSMKVHKKIKNFPVYCFESCSSMKSLDLTDYDDPNSIPTTGYNFLEGCKSLEKIYVKNEEMLNAFKNSAYWSDFKDLICVKE